MGSSYMFLYVSFCVYLVYRLLGCNCALFCGVVDWVLANMKCDCCWGCEGFGLKKFKCLEFVLQNLGQKLYENFV